MKLSYRKAEEKEKEVFNSLVTHPLQLWEWGEFKQRRGVKAIRLVGIDSQGVIKRTLQLFVHPLPLGQALLYYPRGGKITLEEMELLNRLAKGKGAFLVKLEPYLPATKENKEYFNSLDSNFPLYFSSQPLFPEYTLRLDLRLGKERIWKNLHPKTRYNIRLAERKGVRVVEDTTEQGVADFVNLMIKTNKRHNFLSHTSDYYFDLFRVFRTTKVIKILKAVYQDKTIAVWWLFDWKNILYYPYGASDYLYRRLMASNLLAWRAIEYGLKSKKEIFDLWGAAPPGAAANHPWAGFTRFKLSYGAKYWQTIGSWDLVLNPLKYRSFILANRLRKFLLKIRSHFSL